jgi:hypothetical protein
MPGDWISVAIPPTWMRTDTGASPLWSGAEQGLGGEIHIAFMAVDLATTSEPDKFPSVVMVAVHSLPGDLTVEGYATVFAKSMEQDKSFQGPLKRRHMTIGRRESEELRFAMSYSGSPSGKPPNVIWDVADAIRVNVTLNLLVEGRTGYIVMQMSAADAGPDAAAQLDKVSQSFRIGLPTSMLPSDNFKDPAKGLFQDKQNGANRVQLSSGGTHQYLWDYGYANSALVAHVVGPYPKSGYDGSYGYSPDCREKVPGPFAVEVRAKATKSSMQAAYGLGVSDATNDGGAFRALVYPGSNSFAIYHLDKAWTIIAQGRDSAIQSGPTENAIRVELRAGSLSLKVNGREIAKVRHPEVRTTSTSLRLEFRMYGQPDDGDVEIRFSDFKVLALEP